MATQQLRWAIISGASSGLGLEFLKQLKSESHLKFLLIARRGDLLEALKKELALPDSRCECLALDLTQESSFQKIKSHLDQASLEVEWLINNAGFGWMGKFEEQPPENFRSMLHLNVQTVMDLSHLCLPRMGANSKSGNKSFLCNVASSAAFGPLTYFSVYAATKAFLFNWSVALSQELCSKHIVVTAVCPGPVTTPFFEASKISAQQVELMGPKVLFENPVDTVAKALRAARAGKAMVTTGVIGTFFRLISGWLPAVWIARGYRSQIEKSIP